MNTLFTKSEFVYDSAGVGCGHKHPCVFHGGQKKGDFWTVFSKGGLGLWVSNRSGLRPAAIWICGHKTKFSFPLGNRLRFQVRVANLELRVTLRPKSLAICGRGWKATKWGPSKMPEIHGKKTHRHKQICGIVPGLGGWQNFVYVFFFSGHSLWGRKTHKQNPPQNPGTISWNVCLRVFFFMCFFSFPRNGVRWLDSGERKAYTALL